MIVLEIDRDHLSRDRFPELARRLGNNYDVAVSDSRQFLFRSNRTWPHDPRARAELELPLLRVGGPMPPPSRDGWRVLVRRSPLAGTDLVAEARKRNVVVSLAVLVVLALSFILLAVVARRAERLRRQQLDFVAGITHELNTPLAAIRSAGQNLADGVVAPGDATARYGTMIAKESTRLADLVAQILDFAGVQSRSSYTPVPVEVAALVSDAVDRSRWLADEKGVEIETDIPSSLPAIPADGDSLARALQNLIVNAIRHGGTSGPVRISAHAEPRGIAITVADRGAGISPKDAAHVFEPFYRGRDAARVRGSGLGLTIVDQIVRRHGGRVTLDRHDGPGARFTIHLPAHEQAGKVSGLSASLREENHNV